MKTNAFQNFGRIALASGAAFLAALLGAATAQENAAKEAARDAAKNKIEAARDTQQGAREGIRDAREGSRDTAREGRQDIRNTREGARDTAGDAREGARDTARDDRQTTGNTREAARDTASDERQTIRDARRDIRAARREFVTSRIRSGDLGLFLRRMTGGLTVSDIAGGGAISQSGLKEGDEIISINGQVVSSEREFVDQLFANHESKPTAQVVVKRNGKEMTLTVQTKAFVEEHLNSDDRLHDFGLILDQTDPTRVKVQAVVSRSPAFYAGVRSGDQITGFSGQRITQLADFIKSLANANTSTAQMNVNRNNQTRQLEIEVPDQYQGEQPRTALRPNLQQPNAPQQPNTLQQPNATGQQRPVPGGVRTPADNQPKLNPPRQ